jgi:alpha-N-acetylglucosamine transferase
LHLSTVHPSKLEELRRMGATPLEVDPIQPHSDIVPYSPRWIMQFTKLWLFGLTQYDKIVYLDADILIVDNLEPLFDLRRDVRGHEWEQSVRWDYERKSPVLQVLADDVANGTSLDSYAFGAAA